MAFHETNIRKAMKLIRDPKKNIGKIVPFLKSKIAPYGRDLCEFFGSEKYSKPYPGHDALMEHINKKNGFFVQCGGNDGCFQDPTYYLEKFRGWKGIIAEPLPISRLCQRNRKKSIVVQSACVAFDYPEETVSFVDCNAMSFVKNSIQNSSEWIEAGEQSQNITSREIIVPAKTIQSIIDAHATDFVVKPIDLFVADVEGYELDILRGLDFIKNPPANILVEAQNSDRLQKITNYIKPYGYLLAGEIGEKDYLFIKSQ